ncbi:hypothetical protein CEV32_4064 [Brucella rhizosphaerae]|nr:hypothetical protein CEV32_4064 [Brucella rhizosphaerae]
MVMNMQSKPERDRRDQSSSRTLGYFSRFALATLAVLLLLFLGWSLTGGGSVSEKQGIQTLPATGSVDQPAIQQPGENERPQTGTGGDQPSNPPEDQK